MKSPVEAQRISPVQDQWARYKVDVAGVFPAWKRTEFEREDSCFLGVSLENPKFTLPKVTAMAEWIACRFSRCTVLIGDSIHRITLETTRSMPAEAAEAQALRLGSEFVQTRRHVFDSFLDRFQILTCGEVQDWPDYAHYHRTVLDFFQENRQFRRSVEDFARIYHDRRTEPLTQAERQWRIARSSHYFLEEFAIFCCLRRRGIQVMVYPGSFSTLAEIASGVHPGAPAELSDITVISLHFKGRRT